MFGEEFTSYHSTATTPENFFWLRSKNFDCKAFNSPVFVCRVCRHVLLEDVFAGIEASAHAALEIAVHFLVRVFPSPTNDTPTIVLVVRALARVVIGRWSRIPLWRMWPLTFVGFLLGLFGPSGWAYKTLEKEY